MKGHVAAFEIGSTFISVITAFRSQTSYGVPSSFLCNYTKSCLGQLCPCKKAVGYCSSKALENSTIVPNKKKKNLRFRFATLKLLDSQFLAESTSPTSFSMFCKYYPSAIRIPKASEIGTCLCISCQNPQLLIQALLPKGTDNRRQSKWRRPRFSWSPSRFWSLPLLCFSDSGVCLHSRLLSSLLTPSLARAGLPSLAVRGKRHLSRNRNRSSRNRETILMACVQLLLQQKFLRLTSRQGDIVCHCHLKLWLVNDLGLFVQDKVGKS